MPPDVQNIIDSSGKGSRNEIEIELNFPGRTPSLCLILALSDRVRSLLTRFLGKGKKNQVVKCLLTSRGNRKEAEPSVSCSAQQPEQFHTAQHS